MIIVIGYLPTGLFVKERLFMNSEKEPELFILDQAGIAFRGKVPAYVTTLIIERYWKDEVGWWYLTQQSASTEKLSTWIASRDWFDEAYILAPGSMLWLNVDSHYVNYVKKNPLYDPDWQAITESEMWLVERDRSGIHVTRYLLTKGEVSESSNLASPILLEWYKAQALRMYKDRVRGRSLDAGQRRAVMLSVADEVTPWDTEEPDVIALLIAEYWLLNEPLPSQADLPAHRVAETIGDLLLYRVYLALVSALEVPVE